MSDPRTPAESATAPARYVFLTACRNEERILGDFLSELQQAVATSGIAGRVILHVVDDLSFDGSREVIRAWAGKELGYQLVLHEAPTNLGNQGALCLGLQRIEVGPADLLITLDCDGEDDVRELPSIVALARENPGKVVLIERGRRSESLRFKLLFAAYKLLFRFLTQRRVVPNNFMAIPGACVPAFRASPLAAVHFAYALYKLNPPHVSTVRDRRTRYGGKSSQNLFMLVSHGLVGLMLFYEVVVAKLLVLLAVFAALGSGLISLAFLLPLEGSTVRLLAGGSLALACAAVGTMSLLVAAALALIFKLAVYRASLGEGRPVGLVAERTPGTPRGE